MNKKNFLLITPGTFHYFDLAKALQKRQQLVKIITGYPKFKLARYKLLNNFIISSGLSQILLQLLNKIGINLNNFFTSSIQLFGFANLDRLALDYVQDADILLALSGCGSKSGIFFKKEIKFIFVNVPVVIFYLLIKF